MVRAALLPIGAGAGRHHRIGSDGVVGFKWCRADQCWGGGGEQGDDGGCGAGGSQHENDMMDDSNWLDPMTRTDFTAALEKHPIGAPLPDAPVPSFLCPAPTCIYTRPQAILVIPLRPACGLSRSSRTSSRPRFRYLGPSCFMPHRCVAARHSGGHTPSSEISLSDLPTGSTTA